MSLGLDLEYWNSSSVCATFNCYNYATNDDTIPHKQPDGSYNHDACIKTPKGEYHKTKFRCAVIRDGLRPVPKSGCPFGWHLVYYCFSPGEFGDYHWYKKDMLTGIWSHKLGNYPATYNERDSDNFICDPVEDAKKYGYTRFGGYLMAKTDKIS